MILAVGFTPALAKQYVISVNQIVEHPALDAVRQGVADYLAEKGYDVKYNVHIAQGDMGTAVQIANQILGEHPDLVLGIATPTSQACAQVIKDIPILFSAVTDPVAAKLVADIENTGGANITGMSDKSPIDKQVDLMLEIQPGIKTIGVLYNAGEVNSVSSVNDLKAECAKRGLKVEEATAADSGAVYAAAQSLIGRCDAVYTPTDNTVVSAFEAVTKVCTENKLPLYAADVDSVPRGAIAALAQDYYLHGRQAGAMAERILNGEKPGNMPVEFLQDLKLHLSVKNAEAMGVTVPESVKARADEIVE